MDYDDAYVSGEGQPGSFPSIVSLAQAAIAQGDELEAQRILGQAVADMTSGLMSWYYGLSSDDWALGAAALKMVASHVYGALPDIEKEAADYFASNIRIMEMQVPVPRDRRDDDEEQ